MNKYEQFVMNEIMNRPIQSMKKFIGEDNANLYISEIILGNMEFDEFLDKLVAAGVEYYKNMVKENENSIHGY